MYYAKMRIIDIAKAVREQVAASIASFLLAILASWLKFSQDAFRNAVMSFLTDPQKFPDVLFIFAFIAFSPVFLEIYKTFSRTSAVKRGVNRIFEGDNNKGFLVEVIASKWAVSARNDPEFTEEENLKRIALAEIGGRLKLDKLDGSIAKFLNQKEMKKWLKECKESNIPKAWYN